jgi:hypothetical protein
MLAVGLRLWAFAPGLILGFAPTTVGLILSE